MTDFESSIIIPVYNKWDLTRNCLKSLAATTDRNRVEVIVVDNASNDVTPKACAFLGQQLFGSGFKYLRNEQNRNFAGASNQGAEIAAGRFLIFLNNDTRAEAGWYEPLLDDFDAFPNLGATGPLLLYPETGPFGRQVQHLGVLVTPFYLFGHLYQGLPESSALARKRRFFQAITAACMMMEKSLFMEIGKFDEYYINGYEDVDLCGRLTARGYRMTVNPKARVAHYESQTPGRHRHEEHNFSFLREKVLDYYKPDWQKLLQADGFELDINDWVHFQPSIQAELLNELNSKLPDLDKEELKSLLANNIYWQQGWQKLLAGPNTNEETLEYFKIYFKFFRNIPNAAQACKLGSLCGEPELATQGLRFIRACFTTPEELFEEASSARKWCEMQNMPSLAAKYGKWLANYDSFKTRIYPYYQEHYLNLVN